LLVNGELDVALIVAFAEKDDSALKVESVETSRYRVWLPAGHPSAEAERISVRKLTEDRLVLLNMYEIAEAAEQACRLAGVRPPIAIRTQSVEAARSLVATGAGVAVLPNLTYSPTSAVCVRKDFLSAFCACRRGRSRSDRRVYLAISAGKHGKTRGSANPPGVVEARRSVRI
jgi:DNA-binding transcriptional LysR family regulator